ncbi:peptidoglycan recognition protein 3-like [Macrosteles quadrilineatus]|uniref:peptidoglycan recognition protein 3-like n=1 Tax=Macrosteles quadrilineatus TaxID=74068 RepID=UPI0023E0964B|nr:peptidoglycan recognition protein 3-like [Macrosteles quadrilineatus]
MVPWYKRRRNWMDKIPPLEEVGQIVIHREAWGGKETLKAHQILHFPVMFIFMKLLPDMPHHKYMRTNYQKLVWLQKREREINNKSDIKYNFMLGNDGYIYEGRGWEVRPDLLGKGYADFHEMVGEDIRGQPLAARSLLIGHFPGISDEDMGKKMIRAKEALIQFGIRNEYIHKNYKTYIL